MFLLQVPTSRWQWRRARVACFRRSPAAQKNPGFPRRKHANPLKTGLQVQEPTAASRLEFGFVPLAACPPVIPARRLLRARTGGQAASGTTPISWIDNALRSDVRIFQDTDVLDSVGNHFWSPSPDKITVDFVRPADV